jgi:hypothetical protein
MIFVINKNKNAMLSKMSLFGLYLSVFLSGLYGGVGFFTFMGGNPALRKMSSSAFAEYWQHIDSYMGARMPVFGPVLLLSILFTTITLLPFRNSPSFWFMVAAFLIMVADIAFTLSTNHPLNKLIQSWDLQNLPGNVKDIQQQVVHAFWYRSAFMIVSFACVVMALLFKNSYK